MAIERTTSIADQRRTVRIFRQAGTSKIAVTFHRVAAFCFPFHKERRLAACLIVTGRDDTGHAESELPHRLNKIVWVDFAQPGDRIQSRAKVDIPTFSVPSESLHRNLKVSIMIPARPLFAWRAQFYNKQIRVRLDVSRHEVRVSNTLIGWITPMNHTAHHNSHTLRLVVTLPVWRLLFCSKRIFGTSAPSSFRGLYENK